MRYYNIVITDPMTGTVIQQFTNYVNGRIDLGALDVELDISTAGVANPITSSAFIRVWGVSLQQIAQGTDLSGKTIAVYGGMQKGLPLANPAQAGLLVSGSIYPAYGNWIGTDMTLDLQVVPYLYAGLGAPVNIVLNWKAGVPLATALGNALAIAFPKADVSIAISGNLVQSHDEPGVYGNLQQLGQYLKQKTQAMLGGTYPGVDIAQSGSQFVVSDGTATAGGKGAVTEIAFQDLIGQPTWRGLYELQMKCVMRADIPFGASVKLPPTLATVTGAAVVLPGSGAVSRSNSAFQGTFRVIRIRHVGHLRQPDAESWNTTFDLLPNPTQGLPANAGPPI